MKPELSLAQLAARDRLVSFYDDGEYPAGFFDWVVLNEHVYRGFVRLALSMKHSGAEHWSADAVCHVLRWQTAIREHGQDSLKINNNATAGLARLAMARVPALSGFFRTRTPPAKNEAIRLDGSAYLEGPAAYS